MFGYIIPDKEKATPPESALYRAFYCGVCKALKQNYGNRVRIFTSYDITFLSILSHDCLNFGVEFNNENCVVDPFRKKTLVKNNDLLKKNCAVQLLLSKYKLIDDVYDGKKSRNILLKYFKKAMDEAQREYPVIDQIIDVQYNKLRELEKINEPNIDKVSECFALMMRKIMQEIVGKENADEQLLSLAYNLGKYVYLIDAIDDMDDDIKKGNYNPFVASFGSFPSREKFFEKHREVTEMAITYTINKAISAFNERKYNQSYPLLRNVVYYGLRKRADEVFSGKKSTV